MALDLEFETSDRFLSLSVLNVAKQRWTDKNSIVPIPFVKSPLCDWLV